MMNALHSGATVHGDVGNGAAGSFARHGNMFLRREAWIDEPGLTLAVGERGDGATGVLADLRVRGIVTGSHSGSMSGPFVWRVKRRFNGSSVRLWVGASRAR
jgi:hypothetical protein